VWLSCHHAAKILIRNNVTDGVADVHVIGNTSRRELRKKEPIEHLPQYKFLALNSALETKPLSFVGFFEVINPYFLKLS